MLRPFFSKFLIFAAGAAALWLSVRYFLPVLLPFFLAAFLALSAEGAVGFLQRKLRFPRPLAAGIGVSGVFLLLAALTVLLLAGLLRQLPRLSSILPQLEQAVLSGRELLQQWLSGLAAKLPGHVGQVVSGWADGLFSGSRSLAEPFLEKLPGLVTDTAQKMSSGIFGLLTGIIAGFMLSVRLPQLKKQLKNALPPTFRDRCAGAVHGLRKALGGWLLAQLKLAAITLAVLSLGFLILGVAHSFVWAFLITLVDVFPILGVGTVLVPWSFLCLLQGNVLLGIGLLAIWAVAWLLRSVLEPRLVGKGLGLDPLLTLAVIYAGFRLWGIGGMLLAPFCTMAALQLWKAFRAAPQ